MGTLSQDSAKETEKKHIPKASLDQFQIFGLSGQTNLDKGASRHHGVVCGVQVCWRMEADR